MDDMSSKPLPTTQPPKHLICNDLPLLISTLNPVAAKCYDIGLQLGLQSSHLAIIRCNNSTHKSQLREIIKWRLKQEPLLTWSDIVTALQSNTVGEDTFAREIEHRFLHSSCTTVLGTGHRVLSLPMSSESTSVHISSLSPAQASATDPESLGQSSVSEQPNLAPFHSHLGQQHQSFTQSCSVYGFNETGYPAAYMQLSVRPYHGPCSGPSQDRHAAPVTQYPTKVDAPDQRSVSIPTGRTQILATPPIKSSVDSKYSTQIAVSPHSECDDALDHQSEVVEDVINRHTSDLTLTIGNDLQYFSNKFIELGFIRRAASDDILTSGMGNREKGSHLLRLVIINCHTSRKKREWFSNFVSVFANEAAYNDLATSMTEVFEHYVSHAHSTNYGSTNHFSYRLHGPSSNVSLAHTAFSHNKPQCTESQGYVSNQSQNNLVATSHVNAFIDYVKSVYSESKVQKDTSVVKWPPTPSKVYINLACIDRHSVRVKSRAYDEVTEAMVRDGNVDVILEGTKGPIDFSEIAKSIVIEAASDRKRDDKRRLILVEGAPGVGKSTFAWEFCRRWKMGEIAQQYQLVLLLRLREEKISNAQTLEDLIQHPLKAVRQAVAHELVLVHDFHALIILEGFDELPESCRKEGSVLMALIAGKLLPLATVLVTSRPWATKEIRLSHGDRIHQHIEILGFTSQQITEYLESTLSQDKVNDLEVFLVNHPQIRAGMYIPLNCAIVVTVYEESHESGYDMPTTLTELYTSLTRTLLLRYLRGHPEYETGSIFIETFKDLPPAIYDKFHRLCELAYHGTLRFGEVQLIFKRLPSEFDDLGFMDSVTELYVTRGAVSSHNFLHLTFQEFFAAVYISEMSPAEQLEHFKRDKVQKLKVVLSFLAGLSKLRCFSKSEFSSGFFTTPSINECNKYMLSDIAVSIDHVQWLFEAQSDDAIECVLQQKKVVFDPSSRMLPLDYYSLGYCISHSQCQWMLRLGKGEELSGEEVKMLIAGAKTEREPSSKVVGLTGHLDQGKDLGLSISPSSLNVLFDGWRSFLHLHQLSLKLKGLLNYVKWPDLSALRVLKLETTGYDLSPFLSHLSLDSLTVTGSVYVGCVAIGNYIKSAFTMKELDIHLECDSKGVEAITAALASNQSLPLERLELECDCAFTATAGDSVVQFITNTTTLKYLSMRECTFSAYALLVLVRAIHYNPILQTHDLKNFTVNLKDENDVKNLAELLVECKDILTSSRHTSLTGYRAQSLVYLFSTVIPLNLSNKIISNEGGEALAKALHVNPTLTQLDLSRNNISDVGAVALAQALHHNSILMDLDLSHNSISNSGAVALAQALYHNFTLRELNLHSNNSIAEEGTRQLIRALTVNQSISSWFGLSLPGSCHVYATKCEQYSTVMRRVIFFR